jgi:hypothetical protein
VLAIDWMLEVRPQSSVVVMVVAVMVMVMAVRLDRR